MPKSTFESFFQKATGHLPYPYQIAFAESKELPELLNVPTGVGKTAAAILGWAYRRRQYPDAEVRNATPRRLVYCLPMRTLVEQTQRVAESWLEKLGLSETVRVHLLMGGEENSRWDEYPEQDAILIGTQDMLLSRALNRGYGMSRYRWPMHFGLLNNDCLWIMDETQLMGVGLTTTAQLQGLRSKLQTYGAVQSVWMSATLDAEPMTTVDHPEPSSGWRRLGLSAEKDLLAEPVLRLVEAKKPCGPAKIKLNSENLAIADSAKSKGKSRPNSAASYIGALADEVVAAHRPETMTLVVLNRVDRAQRLAIAIEARTKAAGLAADVELVHSRFRPADRANTQRRALDEKSIPAAGRILVTTQAIEAGVDLSATTLFTELAPWPSLVQRFGRCNRRGLCGFNGNPPARVVWIEIDMDDKKSEELALPYSVQELRKARTLLSSDQSTLADVGPATLKNVAFKPEPMVVHALRRKDLVELWDTTPDLAGNDIDVSRFIRDADNNDIQFYWRNWDRTANAGRPPEFLDKRDQAKRFPAPDRQELCSVSIGGAAAFLKTLASQKDKKQPLFAWRWNPLDLQKRRADSPDTSQWERADARSVRPGMVLLLHSESGGYDSKLGWTGDVANVLVPVIESIQESEEPSMSDDDLGEDPQSLPDHLRKVADAAKQLQVAFRSTLAGIPWDAICRSAWWHDVGKAHEAFQTAMHDCAKVNQEDPTTSKLWAKSGARLRPNYRVGDQARRGFRHELVSALAWLHHHLDAPDSDLIAYLIAAHHGKVRLSLRSLPNEARPSDATLRFARGVWQNDMVPTVELGNGDISKEFTIDLEIMELGESKDGKPSWTARVLKLRDDPQFGPFRLSFLETLVRIADWRGSDSEYGQ